MSYQMEFPETFDEFAKAFGFKDSEEIYTNGSELIPVFRVRQWLEHDNKLRTIETDTAYECGKHTNKWIPCSERLPEETGWYLITFKVYGGGYAVCEMSYRKPENYWTDKNISRKILDNSEVLAWMPLPKPYKAEMEGEKDEN